MTLEFVTVRTVVTRLASRFTRKGESFGSQRSQFTIYSQWRVIVLTSRVMTVQVFAFFLTSVMNELDMHYDSYSKYLTNKVGLPPN